MTCHHLHMYRLLHFDHSYLLIISFALFALFAPSLCSHRAILAQHGAHLLNSLPSILLPSCCSATQQNSSVVQAAQGTPQSTRLQHESAAGARGDDDKPQVVEEPTGAAYNASVPPLRGGGAIGLPRGVGTKSMGVRSVPFQPWHRKVATRANCCVPVPAGGQRRQSRALGRRHRPRGPAGEASTHEPNWPSHAPRRAIW